MNYENNNMPGNVPGGQPGQNPGMAPQNSGMYDPNQMNTMNQQNPMNNMNQTMAPSNGVPSKGPKKGLIPIIALVVVVVALVGGLIAFKTITSKPQAIFKNTIKNAYKGISTTLDNVDTIVENFELENKALTVDADISVDSNIEELEELGFEISDLKIGAGLGLDATNKTATVNGFIKGPKEEVNVKGYYTDDKVYIDTNLLDNIVYVEDQEVDIDYDEINELLAELKEAMPKVKDVDYIGETITNAIADSLDDKYMSKENEKIELDGKEETFTRYSYKLTDEALKNLVTETVDKLLDDKKFISTLADLIDQDEDDVKEALKELKESAKEIEYEEKIVLNVYTKGVLNTFAGLSLEVENEEVLKYVDNGKKFSIVVKEEDEEILVIEGTRDKETNMTINYEGEKVAEITIKEFTDKKKDLSFKVFIEDNTIGGSIYLTYNESKEKIDGDYKVQIDYNDQYIKAEGSYKFTSSNKLDIPDMSKAVNVETVDEDDLYDALETKAENDVVINAIFGETISDYKYGYSYVDPYDPTNPYEYDDNDVDSYGMIQIFDDEIESLMTSKDSMVLYVGYTFFYSDEEEEQEFFKSLQELQDEYDFNSYRTTYLGSEAENLLSNAVVTCSTNAECLEEPVAYFIKDGKVVKALAAPSNKEELLSALTAIGLAE